MQTVEPHSLFGSLHRAKWIVHLGLAWEVRSAKRLVMAPIDTTLLPFRQLGFGAGLD